MSINPNMANKEVANLVLLNYKNKTPFLNIDFANVTTTDLSATRTFAKGGRGAANRVAFDEGRTGTIKIDTQITPMKLYAMLSGSEIEDTATFMKRMVLVSASGILTIPAKYVPVTDSIYVYASGDDCGKPVSFTVSDNQLTLADTAAGEFIVYFMVKKSGEGVQTVKFNAKTFPKAFTIYGETPYKTEDDEIVAMKLVYYKAQPQAIFSLALSNTGDPATLSITCDLLADENDNIYDMSIIDDEE